jgi:hypothetical protein
LQKRIKRNQIDSNASRKSGKNSRILSWLEKEIAWFLAFFQV